jgi:hypothetical protein
MRQKTTFCLVGGKEKAAEGQGQKKRRAGKLGTIHSLCHNLRKKANHKNFAPLLPPSVHATLGAHTPSFLGLLSQGDKAAKNPNKIHA